MRPRGDLAIQAERIKKHFGPIHALDGIDLEIARGTTLGLLGPNGSGKTTFVRVLATLTHPDSGRALVEGHDIVRDAPRVRRLIGLAGQFSAVDDHLTGFENIVMAGQLFHLHRRLASRRARDLLERLDLAEAADRRVKTYSGGMRRRLDLAASLVAHPSVIFLDEPTTGLDPHSRLGLWEIIRELVREGATLLLTTQYLDEADQLADQIVVIDHGRVIAKGTPGELKDRVGGDVLECQVAAPERLDDAISALEPLGTAAPQVDRVTGTFHVAVGNASSTALVEAVRRLDAADIALSDLALHRPSLDDAFLSLTGHAVIDDELGGSTRRTARRGNRGQRRGTPDESPTRYAADAIEAVG
ncbi:MAG TPA: ATP-binding cassette domain-containing protein [Acidimicrobiales bacterium]|nr:ATP-binding cassette domain-containing protein [Acidimicrobiales bacterium]